MSPTGHFAMGFAAKAIDRAIPLWLLLTASWAIDLLYFVFQFAGLDSADFAPWSHSLLMAALWSALGALISFAIYQKIKTSVVIALTIFSHWLLDFIVWKHNPLTFDPTLRAGFGLYEAIGFNLADAGFNRPSIIATAIEAGMLAAGIIFYLARRGRKIAATR